MLAIEDECIERAWEGARDTADFEPPVRYQGSFSTGGGGLGEENLPNMLRLERRDESFGWPLIATTGYRPATRRKGREGVVVVGGANKSA